MKSNAHDYQKICDHLGKNLYTMNEQNSIQNSLKTLF